MTSLEWLQSATINLEGRSCSILTELCTLVAYNGGLEFKGFGVMASGGPLGRLGVSKEEAMRLLYMTGILDGFSKAENGASTKDITQAIKSEIHRLREERNKPKIVGADGMPVKIES